MFASLFIVVCSVLQLFLATHCGGYTGMKAVSRDVTMSVTASGIFYFYMLL